MEALDFYEYFANMAEEDPTDHKPFIDPLSRYIDILDCEDQLFLKTMTTWEAIALGRSL